MARYLHLAIAAMLLCGAVVLIQLGVMEGFASFVLLGLMLVYLAFEKAQRAFQ